MLRPISSFGLAALLLGGCTRVPADVSAPDDSTPASRADRSTPEPISGECDPDELQTCADVCGDRDCLDWCAGSGCVATIASLWSCMDEGERRFAAEHPSPQLEFETVIEDGEEMEYPTEESMTRQSDWEFAYEDAIVQHWDRTCAATCSNALPSPDGGAPEFCVNWRNSYYTWSRLTRPRSEHAGALASMVGSGMLGTLSLGTSMSLTGKLGEPSDDPRHAALHTMVSRAGWELHDASSCVPELDEQGTEFSLMLSLEPGGEVRSAAVVDGQISAGECVADRVAAALELPARVARDFPQLEVRVLVKPMPDYFGEGLLDGSSLGDGGFGELEGVGWGYGGLDDGGFAGEFGSDGLDGEAAESSGGFGRGGGGAVGYGSGGLGSIESDTDADDESD